MGLKKRPLRVRVASINMNWSIPRPWRLVLKVLLRRPDIICWQECRDADQRAAVRRMPRGVWATWWPSGNPAKSVPISYRRNRYKVLARYSERAHAGIKGVSASRWVNGLTLQDMVTDEIITVFCTHFISGIQENPERMKYWNILRDLVREMAQQALVEHGGTVIIGADWNRNTTISGWKMAKPVKATHKTGAKIDYFAYAGRQVADTPRVYNVGSDHKMVLTQLTAPQPLKKEKPMSKKYERPNWRGRTNVDALTIAAIEAAEKNAGHQFTVTQGSYQSGHGDSNSAGTHDGGGVVDLRWCRHPSCIRHLRNAGFAAWHRTPKQGPWPDHIHAVVVGHSKLAPSAARQVDAYRKGRNGLANNGPDDGPRVKIRGPVWPPAQEYNNVQRGRAALHRALRILDQAQNRPAVATLRRRIRAAMDKAPKK